MPEYELRLHHADGTLSIVMRVTAVSDADAKAQAEKMLNDGLEKALVWRDGKLVDTAYRTSG